MNGCGLEKEYKFVTRSYFALLFFSKNKPAGLLENLEGVDDEETMDDEEKPRRISPF